MKSLSPLRLQFKEDFFPQQYIEDSIRGVEFDYFYTGKRLGTGKEIELHVTSVVTDWDSNVYIRKAWYLGSGVDWKKCIEGHIRDHLNDLSTGAMLVMQIMRYFEVSEEKCKEWEKYKPVYHK